VGGGARRHRLPAAGPLGALLAAGLFRLILPERRTLTAKLFHDERYRSPLRTHLPARPASGARAGGG
jgi:hypothetical protein